MPTPRTTLIAKPNSDGSYTVCVWCCTASTKNCLADHGRLELRVRMCTKPSQAHHRMARGTFPSPPTPRIELIHAEFRSSSLQLAVSTNSIGLHVIGSWGKNRITDDAQRI